MEQEKNKNGVITSIVIIIAILLILIIIFITGAIKFSPSNIINNKKIHNNTKDIIKDDNYDIKTDNTKIFDYSQISIEEGFTEINLSDEEKRKINKELYDELRPGDSFSIFSGSSRNYCGVYTCVNNMFEDDCNKMTFAKWYVFNGNQRKLYEKYVKNDINEYGYNNSKISYENLLTVAKQMFNVEKIECAQYKENEYIWNWMGGGSIMYVIRVLAKYNMNNEYYLIIHVGNAPSTPITNEVITNPEDDIIDNHIFAKLKYEIKDDGNKYIINLEYLN